MLTPLKIFGGAAVIAIILFVVIQSGAVDINNTIPSHNTDSALATENNQKNEILRDSAGLESELIKAGWESNAAHAVVDSLHRHYSGIKIQPMENYENEDLAFEIAIPRRLSLEQVLETCHKECLKAEDKYDLFIFPHVVYDTPL